MKTFSLYDFTRGWLVGNFTPSLIRTEHMEVGVIQHKAGDQWPPHYHKEADEFNVVLSGSIRLNGREFGPGDIIQIEPGEVATPEFPTDCTLLVIKHPSVPGDKYVIDNSRVLD